MPPIRPWDELGIRGASASKCMMHSNMKLVVGDLLFIDACLIKLDMCVALADSLAVVGTPCQLHRRTSPTSGEWLVQGCPMLLDLAGSTIVPPYAWAPCVRDGSGMLEVLHM